MFRKYHYLDFNLHRSSKCFLGTIKKIPVCFIAIIHFPHPLVKNIKKVHRLVVLPDYQGFGIGSKFLNFIANIYRQEKWRFSITTSTPALINSFRKSHNWLLKSFRRNTPHRGFDRDCSSAKRLTTSWEYIGETKQ